MAAELQLVGVTPETTLVDEPVAGLRFPLFDGQAGVLPGRAPLVGRLGAGELSISQAGGVQRSYFVDGGFVQITGQTVTLLTARCIPADAIDGDSAQSELQEALARSASSDQEIDARFRDQDRARRMLEMKK